MIEIRENADPDFEDEYQLFIDGVLMDKAKVETFSPNYFSSIFACDIFVSDPATFERLAQYRFSDLPDGIRFLKLELKFDWLDSTCDICDITIDLPHNKRLIGKSGYKLSFSFGYHLANWAKPYSFAEYMKEFSRIYNPQHIQPALMNEAGLFFRVLSVSPQAQIGDEIARYTEYVLSIGKEVEKSLALRVNSDSIAMTFDFPEEVRVPCEQYLLYFIQFLRDLGVEATSELRHEAGQVLFSVTPTAPQQALDKIRAALDIYLQLASSPISDTPSNEIAVQKLEANILRLRSDLKLAAAELQAKNATIQAQQLTLNIQQGLLSGEIVVDSLKDITPKPKDKDTEELLKGIVEITPYEGKGFIVNLPKLYRWLKQLFTNEQ